MSLKVRNAAKGDQIIECSNLLSIEKFNDTCANSRLPEGHFQV